MPYSTQSDLENRLGAARVLQIADLDGDGEIDAAALGAAIERADGLIDAYLRGRYVVPLAAAPAVVRELSVDLALYFLSLARRESVGELDRQTYLEALRFLENVALGRAGIDLGDGADGLADANLPQVTTPLATHQPVFRKNAEGTSGLEGF